MRCSRRKAKALFSGFAAEEIADPGKEAFGFGMRALFARLLKIAQQFLLFLGKLDRRLDRDLNIKIAFQPAAAKDRHAFSAQADLLVRLRAFGDRNLGALSVQRRHFDFAAKGCGDERNWRAAM